MGNFSVVGVMLAYIDDAARVPPLRRQHRSRPRSVSEVHAALLELVTAGHDPPDDRPARSRMDEVAAALDDHEHRRTSGRTVVDVADAMTPISTPTRCSRRRARPTGLDDFGPDSFREGLERYCESLDRRGAAQRARRRSRSRGMIVGSPGQPAAGRRLDRTHPEVRRRAHRRPDRRDRHVPGRHHAAQLPARPGPAEPGAAALGGGRQRAAADAGRPPRRAAGRRGRTPATRCSAQLNPQIEVVHHEQADGPTECITVMGQDFKSLTWEAIANVPSYGEWLLGVDQRSAYEYHRAVLQVLQSGGVRGRWTLKSPHHADRARAPHRGVPRRAPGAAAPRSRRARARRCAASSARCRRPSPTPTTAPTSPTHWPAMLEESVGRIDAFRDAHPEHPIVDVQYADLVDRSGRRPSRRSTAPSATSSTTPARAAIADLRRRPPEGRVRRPPLRRGRVRPRRRRARRTLLRLHRPLRRPPRALTRPTPSLHLHEPASNCGTCARLRRRMERRSAGEGEGEVADAGVAVAAGPLDGAGGLDGGEAGRAAPRTSPASRAGPGSRRGSSGGRGRSRGAGSGRGVMSKRAGVGEHAPRRGSPSPPRPRPCRPAAMVCPPSSAGRRSRCAAWTATASSSAGSPRSRCAAAPGRPAARASWSGCSARASSPPAIALRVVSAPAAKSREKNMYSSTSVSAAGRSSSSVRVHDDREHVVGRAARASPRSSASPYSSHVEARPGSRSVPLRVPAEVEAGLDRGEELVAVGLGRRRAGCRSSASGARRRRRRGSRPARRRRPRRAARRCGGAARPRAGGSCAG